MTKNLGGVYSYDAVYNAVVSLLVSLDTILNSEIQPHEHDVHDLISSSFETTNNNHPLHLSKKDDFDELQNLVLELWDERTKNEKS